MSDYLKMTQADYDRILISILKETKASELISVPGFYEIVSEEFNNDILSKWDDEQA